ncbi:hypothetical protein KY285_030168 [Solanum tuberosum]|nr:hypothetical protein KY285_030168 [Solanum tuberosum]
MLLSSSLAGAAGIVAGLAVSPLLLEFARRGRRRGASARCLEQHRCWPELFSLALLVLFAGKENRREGGGRRRRGRKRRERVSTDCLATALAGANSEGPKRSCGAGERGEGRRWKRGRVRSLLGVVWFEYEL